MSPGVRRCGGAATCAHQAIALDQLVDHLEPIPEMTVLDVVARTDRP